MPERRSKYGALMCVCDNEAHKGTPCPNEATMGGNGPRYDPPRCTSCQIGRFCK